MRLWFIWSQEVLHKLGAYADLLDVGFSMPIAGLPRIVVETFPLLFLCMGSFLCLVHYKYFKYGRRSFNMILPSKVQEFWFSIAEASVPKRETRKCGLQAPPAGKGGCRHLGPGVQSLESSESLWTSPARFIYMGSLFCSDWIARE